MARSAHSIAYTAKPDSTPRGKGTTGFPQREAVRDSLERKLTSMKEAGEHLDVITFSGNGEPTLHPDFAGVIDDTIDLRNRYFPDVKISVLSNATRAMRPEVAAALRRVDNNILKLDSAVTPTMRKLDRPGAADYTSEKPLTPSQLSATAVLCRPCSPEESTMARPSTIPPRLRSTLSSMPTVQSSPAR